MIEPALQEIRTTPREPAFWLARMSRPVFFLVIVLFIAGLYGAFQVPISVIPETNFPRVVIGVDNGVMPVEQMQVTITKPIEDAVNSVPGLVMVRSTTSRGSAEVSLFFNWGVDMIQTLQLTDAALSKVRQTLPSTAVITTNRLTFATFPILGYALTADNRGPDTVSPTRLWEIATYDLKPPLNRVGGVSTVTVQGGQVPEYHIIPNMARLQNAGVTLTDLVNAVQASNIIDSPGLYEANHELILALVGAQAHDAAHLAGLTVKATPTGSPVRVADVAEVRPGTLPVYTTVTANAVPSVLLSIARQPSSNTVQVANAVAAEVNQLQRILPAGVHLTPFYDQSQLVRESIASVRDAIFIGLVLACLILFLFLRDWTSSLIAGLVIPVTVAVTILFLWAIGESFNLMTLGGLAAAIGLVIDDAIVVVENVVVHRDRGQSRTEAVRLALSEISTPLVFSTITPVVVFLPLIVTSGVTGSFLRALATTMTAALLTSLALAVTFTPALSMSFLRHGRNGTDEEPLESNPHHDSPMMQRILRVHERALSWALARPLWLGIACAALVVATWFGYSFLGSGMLPKMDEGAFILDYFTPAGTSLTETNRILTHVEQILHDTPEVEITTRRTGLQLGLAAVTEANRGDFTVLLKRNRKRNIEDIMADVRERIQRSEPSLDVEFIQVLQDMIGDLSNQPEDIVIKLFSNDTNLLNQLGPRVETEILKIKDVTDTKNGVDDTISGPATSFQVDPVVAARLGFTPTEVAEDATAILDGLPTTDPMIVNGRPYTVRVRLPDENRASLEAMQNTVFNSSSGHTASLGSLAEITELPPQGEILRENLQRLITVTGRLKGTDLGGTMQKVRAAVDAMHLPSSVRVEYGGTYEEQQKSFRALLQVLMLALALVFGVLLAEFRNFAAPIAILSSSVLSISGVVLALLITGADFNVASFMGLIMVIGIVAKNGILLLDADERYRSADETSNVDGADHSRDIAHEAMMHAAQRRLRPIMMTAIAAVCGMLPLAFGIGSGSEMLKPLAIAVIGGLLISVVLSLIVTPAVYYRLNSKRHT